jgi:hypothetical protein
MKPAAPPGLRFLTPRLWKPRRQPVQLHLPGEWPRTEPQGYRHPPMKMIASPASGSGEADDARLHTRGEG